MRLDVKSDLPLVIGSYDLLLRSSRRATSATGAHLLGSFAQAHHA